MEPTQRNRRSNPPQIHQQPPGAGPQVGPTINSATLPPTVNQGEPAMPSRLSPQSQFNGPPQARSQDSPSSSSPHARPTITRSSTIKDSRNYVNATGVSTILGSAPQSYSQSPSPPPAFHSSSSPSTVALQSGYDSSVRPQIPPNAVLGLQHVPENNGLPISLPNPHPAASLPQQQPSYPPPRPPVALQGPTGASRNDSQSDDWMTERQDPTSAVREVVTKHGAPQYDRSEALLDFYPRSTTPQHTSVVPSAPVGPSYPFQSQSQAPVFAERERDRSRRSPPADTSPVSQAFGGGISAKSRPNRPRLETAASAPARPQYENDYDVPRQEDERSTPPQSQRSSASSYVYVHSNTSTSTAPAAIPTPPRATPPHTQTLPNRPADANIKHDEPPTPPRRESPTYHTPSESPAETVDRIVPNRTLSYTPTGPAPHHSYGPPFQYDDAPRQHDRQPQAQHLPQVLPRQVQAQQPQSHTQQRQPHSQQAQEPSQPPSVHRLVEPPLNQPQRVPDRSLPVQEEADPDADDRDVHSQRHHRTSRHASGEKWASPLLSHQPRQQSPGIYYQQPYGISVQQPYGVPIQRSSTLPQHLYSNSSHLEFDSPTPSSTLINPESDIDPERNHFTPRSPVAALPASPNNQAFFAANGAFKPRRPMDPSHFQHSYFASQMGAMPIPRGPSRTNYVPPHPQFTDANLGPANGAYNQYDAEAYRVPSSASNHQPNSRPSAPVPPTPHSATNAPTPAPQTHHHSHSQGQFISSVPEGARHIPSALSSYMSSPWPSYYPFLPAPLPPQSIVSSPSHQPVPLPKRRQSGLRYGTKKPKTRSFRAESTEPMSSSSSNDGDLTEGRARSGDDRDDEEEEEEDEWVVEDEEDLLDNEYHPKYIVNPAKRRRRFQQKWEALVKLFHEIDRSTDTTMLLIASEPVSPHYQTHVIMSRSIMREQSYQASAAQARAAFAQISSARRRAKAAEARARRQEAQRRAGLEQEMAEAAFMGRKFEELGLLDAESLQGEEGLKAALGVALGSLRQMHRIYEQREERRREEAERQRQESAGIEALLSQVLSMEKKKTALNANGKEVA